eukprot:m.396448 g.396448  ORF g.396448 m.396448 type:complete len:381 (-) comp16772_c1_seq31:753-1895(-)
MPGLSKEQQDRIARNRAAALERRAGKRAAVTPMSLDVPDQSSAAVASGAASAGFTAAPAARGLDAMTPDIAAHKAMEIEEELENDQIRREAAKRVRDASTATAPAVSKKTRGAREAAAEAQNSVPVGLNATMATAALMGARFAKVKAKGHKPTPGRRKNGTNSSGFSKPHSVKPILGVIAIDPPDGKGTTQVWGCTKCRRPYRKNAASVKFCRVTDCAASEDASTVGSVFANAGVQPRVAAGAISSALRGAARGNPGRVRTGVSHSAAATAGAATTTTTCGATNIPITASGANSATPGAVAATTDDAATPMTSAVAPITASGANTATSDAASANTDGAATLTASVSLTSLPNLTNWYRHYENGAWMCLSNLSTIPATWKN